MGMAVILVMLPGLFEQTFIPHPKEAAHEIWLQSAQWFQRRCLKMLTYTRTTEAYLHVYYKLRSGELTRDPWFARQVAKRLPNILKEELIYNTAIGQCRMWQL